MNLEASTATGKKPQEKKEQEKKEQKQSLVVVRDPFGKVHSQNLGGGTGRHSHGGRRVTLERQG